MKMKAKDVKITMTKIIINDKLFDILNDENPLCVKDIYCCKDNNIYEKYAKICGKAHDNCGECWKQFIIEDLIKIDEQKIIPSKSITCDKEGAFTLKYNTEEKDNYE